MLTATEISPMKLVHGPSTIRVEQRVFAASEEGVQSSTPRKKMFSVKQEIQPAPSPQAPSAGILTHFEKPERSIRAHNTHASSVDTPALPSEQISHKWNDENKGARTASPPVGLQLLEETVSPKTIMKNPLVTRTQPAQEDPIENEVRSQRAPFPLKGDLDSANVLQPVLPLSHLAGRGQLEDAQKHEPQNVVEVHIGRVEVRAMATPATQQSKPRSAAVMTLDEYLKRRKAGERS